MRHETRTCGVAQSAIAFLNLLNYGDVQRVSFSRLARNSSGDISRLQKKEDRNEMQSRRRRLYRLRRRQTAANRREIF